MIKRLCSASVIYTGSAAYTKNMGQMLTEIHMDLLKDAAEQSFGKPMQEIQRHICLAGDYFNQTSPLWAFLGATVKVIPMDLGMMSRMLQIPEYNSGLDNAEEILEDCRKVLLAEDMSDLAKWIFKGKDPVWRAASPMLEDMFKDRYHILNIAAYNELLVPDSCVLARWRLNIEM
jgi:hypothetical protein